MFDKRSFLILFFVVALVGLVFASGVDLAIVSTSVDGNLYGNSITFSIDYNNLGSDANVDYNVIYDINGINVVHTISDDLNAEKQDSNNYVWDANLYGKLDINICVNYPDDANTENDCNDFNLLVYHVDLNANSLNSTETAVYGADYNLDFNYSNLGDYNNYNYNVKFYIDGNLADTIPLSNLKAGDSNVYTYTFNKWHLISDLNDINAYACLDSNNNINANNNCKEFDFNAKYSDFNAYDLNFSDTDANIDYGDDVNINFYYSNIGDHNLLSDYNILYYANGSLIHTQTIKSDLNYDDSNFDYNTWSVNVGGDVNIMVCASYPYDYNSDNNCLSKILHVRTVDLEAVYLSLDDSSVSAGASVTATLTYKNSGDANATEDYNIVFYENGDKIPGCSFTVDSDLSANDSNQTKCTFTAPSPSSNTNYDIKGVLEYNGHDASSSNDFKSHTLSVTAASTNNTDNTDNSNTDNSSGVDLEAVSLVYPETSLINKPVTFKFNFKNIGDNTATDSYTAKVLITHNGKTVKNCVKTISEDLGSGKTQTYSCVWTPNTTGYYSLTSRITYVGTDDATSNDFIENKMIHIVSNISSPKPKPPKPKNNENKNAVITLGKNKTLETYTDVNVLIKDVNSLYKDMNLSLPDNFDTNNIYLDLNITRDFNCGVSKDTNKPYCEVNVTLKNVGDKNLTNYEFYEILPDLNDVNAQVLMFDINKLDVNKDFKFTYAVASNIEQDKQAKFLGFVLEKPKQEIAKSTNPKVSNTAKIVTLILILFLAVLLIALLVVYLLGRKKNKGFKYYKKHKFRVEEPEPKSKWVGVGNDSLPRKKYKPGKYKVKPKASKKEVNKPKYKGWKKK